MINLNNEEKSILFGTVLGDAYLQKTGEKNARLKLEHGAKQKDYLFWKVEKLQKLFQGKPKYLKRIHPVTQKEYRYWRHQSQSTPYLGKIHKIFYPKGKKQIPQELKEYLNPLALAVWYMDDGYYYQRDRCSYLYLGNVSQKEAENVSQTILEKFNIANHVLVKKKGYAIYFSPKETLKLKEVIKNYLVEKLRYKLPL